MKSIYLFNYTSRGGDLAGAFVADSYYLAKLLNGPAEERQAEFGEVLGKHSEVGVELDNSLFKLVSSDPEEVGVFEKLFPNGIGYDPRDYLSNEEEL